MGLNLPNIGGAVGDAWEEVKKNPAQALMPNPITGLPAIAPDPVMDQIEKLPIKVPGMPGSSGGQEQQQPVYTPTPMTPEERAARHAEIRAERRADIRTGRREGRDLFEGKLGRVGQKRTAQLGDIINRRQEQAIHGLGARAFQAGREARLRGLDRAAQLQQRQLAGMQGRMGIRGGSAAGQLAQLMGQQQRERQAAEQDLFLQDVAQRQKLLGDYETAVRQAEADELARQKFNIGQVGREKFGELASGLGEAQLGAAERTGIGQTDIGRMMAAAMAQQGSGGKASPFSLWS